MPAFDWTTFWPAFMAVLIDKPLKVLIIIVVAIVLRGILQLVIRRVVNRIVSGVKKKQNVDDTQALQASPLSAVRIVQRTRTIGSVLSNLVTTVIVIVSIILIVDTLNTNATAAFSLITAALGAGLGFGAQNIIKDVLNGLFLVIEDQVGVGDVIDTGFATGVVESVGIRVTQVRDVNGVLWYVRNGEMVRIGNMSQGWSRVIIDLGVPYDVDIEEVEQQMLDTALDMQQVPKWKRVILERPEIWGIESISAEAVVVRLVVKTRSGSKDDVARELRARLKATLDSMDVRLPALNSIVLSGFESAGSVRGARPPKTAQLPTAPAAPHVSTEDPKPRKPPRSSD